MGKADELRALREARYTANRKAGAGMQGQRVSRGIVDEVNRPPSAPVAIDDLCGHQAIGGKRCIRTKDHSEKNHRYAKTPK